MNQKVFLVLDFCRLFIHGATNNSEDRVKDMGELYCMFQDVANVVSPSEE